ncbi:MAG: hypothetical protein KJZ86_27555, partial [Caldilineaceae bacterium]|nr:hypothetical protein [Caldilineaceae bacterium]
DLPPLASRILAAAGWSFAVVCLLVLERPTDRRLRLVLRIERTKFLERRSSTFRKKSNFCSQ